jgi:hypothetical protein
MFSEMSVSPLCFAPFSITDFVYNPVCYTQPLVNNLSEWLAIYLRLNLLVTQKLFTLIAEYWHPALYVGALSAIIMAMLNVLLIQENEEPLTLLESEIAQCIYSNASTGCTARMLHERLYGFYENREVEMEEITKALQKLKRRGLVISVEATLWLTTGK